MRGKKAELEQNQPRLLVYSTCKSVYRDIRQEYRKRKGKRKKIRAKSISLGGGKKTTGVKLKETGGLE